MYRKREAQDRDRADLVRRPARDARSGRSPAHDQRETSQGLVAKLRDDRDPGRVELGGRRRAAPSRHAIRLLDERHAHSRPAGSLRSRDEVGRLDAAACPVPQYHRADR